MTEIDRYAQYIARLSPDEIETHKAFSQTVRGYLLEETPVDSEVLLAVAGAPHLAHFVLKRLKPELPDPVPDEMAERGRKIDALLTLLWDRSDERELLRLEGVWEFSAQDEDDRFLPSMKPDQRYGIPGVSSTIYQILARRGRKL